MKYLAGLLRVRYVFIYPESGDIVLAISTADSPAVIETMRREGYELQVSRPEVILRQIDGKTQEPYERITIDIPPDYIGEIQHALAGLIVAARLNSATPSAGLSFELDVIAACFIGGASAYGGVGKVMGVVIGAFVMGVMNNGMSIYGLGIYWQQVVKGIVLLTAVYVDLYQKSKE